MANTIEAAIDDEVHQMTLNIQKKFNLTWDQATNHVNAGLKSLIMGE